MIWMVSVIVGSLSLVTLFSPNGLVLMAVLLGIIFALHQGVGIKPVAHRR